MHSKFTVCSFKLKADEGNIPVCMMPYHIKGAYLIITHQIKGEY